MPLEMTRRPNGLTEVGREIMPLRTMMDRLLESAFAPSFPAGWAGSTASAGFGWDVYEDENAFYIHSYLPGVDPNTVSVTVQDNVLIVSGETKRKTPEHWRALIQELGYGQFERRLTLATPVEAGRASADYDEGILKITLPKAEVAKPRQIKVGRAASS